MNFWLIALTLICCGPVFAQPLPLPDLKSPADLPHRAKAKGPIFGADDSINFPVSTPVFVVLQQGLPEGIIHQNRLWSGNVEDLQDLTPVSASEHRAIVAALRDPSKVASLDARGLRLLDATLVAWLTRAQLDPAQRWPQSWADRAATEVRALQQVLNYRRDVVWEIFLTRWMVAQSEKDPRPPVDVVATHLVPLLQGMDLSGLYRTVCQRRQDYTTWIGPYLLRGLPNPALACLRDGYRRFLQDDGSVGGHAAYDLYPRLFSATELQGLLDLLLKRDTKPARAHVVAALAVWGQVPLAPYRPALRRWAGEGDCAAFQTLRLRAPGRELDPLALKLVERGACGSALEWLAREAPASDAAHLLLLQQAKTATGLRRQQWVAALAETVYARRSRSFLASLHTDEDEVVRGIAWQARRTLALADLEPASREQRAKLRQDYLAEVRARVEALRAGSTIVGREPLFMLKPGGEVVLRLSPFPAANDVVRIKPLALPDIPFGELVPSDPLRLRRHDLPASTAPIRYSRLKGETIGELRLRLEDIKIDGQPLADIVCPGLFLVEVGSLTGVPDYYRNENNDPPWPTRVAWYCEPDDRLWSDAAYGADAQ